MRLKSKYRRQEFEDGGRVDLPGQKELLIEQPTKASAAASAVEPPQLEAPQPEKLPQAQQAEDTAAAALRRQLDELKRSEELQWQPVQHRPSTREEKINLWKQHGLDATEESFLLDHPQMIDRSEMTNAAASAVLQAGIKRGSPEYWNAVESTFAHLIQTESNPAMQPTPKFFEPQPVSPPPSPPQNPARIFSAPVSREVPDGSGSRTPRGKITLSRDQVEAARLAGVDLKTYAEGVARLEIEKQNGERQR